MLLTRVTGFVQNLVGLPACQTLIPKMNRQAGQFSKLSGKGLCPDGLRAQVSGKMNWIAHYDPHNSELPCQSRQRAEIVPRNAASGAPPLQREHRLCRESQLV